ncbi:MAG: 2-amino-4-hydroxy-6-hydroxymethyldihydropteridine diphosphokinase [Sphingomonas sp. 28-62-11]|nr:MAG: 2-amino-4-hydroxy-6-hydroxymethyldihydropteridine diphosphokinase [Sphingomonas sp. 28-62-11]
MPSDVPHYAIALGANRVGLHGGPSATLAAALAEIGGVIIASPVAVTAPVGPSIRRFANQVAIIASDEAPPVLLSRLKAIEAAFGRRRGQRWGARVIDLDIILWSQGAWASPGLTVPHAAFRDRMFVLGPLAAVAPDWRDPVTGLCIRHLRARRARHLPLMPC